MMLAMMIMMFRKNYELKLCNTDRLDRIDRDLMTGQICLEEEEYETKLRNQMNRWMDGWMDTMLV